MIVYISGPYTGGDTVLNVRHAILMGDRVMDLGHTPIVPHLTLLAHMVAPQEYRDWLGACVRCPDPATWGVTRSGQRGGRG